MERRALGTTGLEISPIGFGAWAIGGGGWIEGWGPQSDDESIAAIHRAIDRGINWIDTAGAYGLGHSERVIGRALRGLRERPLVFTKCTSTWDADGNFLSRLDEWSIRAEVEGSLARLEVDALDVCQIHMPFPDEQIEEGWATLAALRDEGKIRHIGVSNFDLAQLRRADAIAHVESLQPVYSLLNREIETDVLPYCAATGVGVVVYSPMASGLLTGTLTKDRLAGLAEDDWRRRWPDFQSPRVDRTLAFVDRLRPVAERLGCTLAQLAVAWTTRSPAVTGATVGLRRPDQVDAIAAAADVVLDDDALAAIEAAAPGETLFSLNMEGELKATP